jgi:HD superfamily phosphohydrolase
MEFRELEASLLEVLRAEELQRLRRVRQLGLVHLAFPAAEHSRLVHSIGAAHVALRFTRRLENATREFLAPPLQPNAETRRDLALAALCHDIGHGPLSHAWEKEVVPSFDPVPWCEKLELDPADFPPGKTKWHELVGQAILLSDATEIHQLLKNQEAELPARLAALLRGQYHLEYMPPLLASDIDVDRCDYVLRDAHQSGVAYGRFDLNWLISTATIGDIGGNLVVGFDQDKAPRVIEQFLVARRALYGTVYQHRIARSAEGMVGLLLRRVRHLVRENQWPLSKDQYRDYQKALIGEPVGVKDLLMLDDYSLWVFIISLANEGKDQIAADLAKRIVKRDLFKEVPVSPIEISSFVGNYGRGPLEAVVSEKAGVEGAYYFVYDQHPLDTFSRDYGEASYLVEDTGEGPGSASLAKNHPQLRHLDEETSVKPTVYAPVEAREALRDVITG